MVASSSGPKPWEFPLASPESRAAARAILDERERGVRRFQLVHSDTLPREDESQPHVGGWTPIERGYMRVVYVPQGTDPETRERILATP